MKQTTVSDVVFQLCDEMGLTTLANELEMDKATLSRFRSGECGLTLDKLDRLLGYARYRLVQETRYRRLVDTIITLSELTKEGMGL